MYLDFYCFTKAPFHSTPDPAFLFPSPSHTAALQTMIYGIEERQGLVVILGEAGVGKTTLLRSYLERVNPYRLTVMVILDAQIAFGDLLRTMFYHLGRAVTTDDPGELVQQFHGVLIDEYLQGRNMALIIDEAHLMPVETLEQLHLLSPREMAMEPLLQIVLLGQPALQHTLNRQELGQLGQRIVLCSTILPLTAEESVAYIHHRLAQVTRHDSQVFTNSALQRIVRQAQGIPRTLNSLCTHALLAGFGAQQRPITSTLVHGVITEYTGKQPHRWWQRRLALGVGLMLVAGLAWGAPWQRLSSQYPLFSTSTQAQSLEHAVSTQTCSDYAASRTPTAAAPALQYSADVSPTTQVQTHIESVSTSGAEHSGNNPGAPPLRPEKSWAQSTAHSRQNDPEKSGAPRVGSQQHSGKYHTASSTASHQLQQRRYANFRWCPSTVCRKGRQRDADRLRIELVDAKSHIPSDLVVDRWSHRVMAAQPLISR